MTRRRGPFDSRLDRLEQTIELPVPGEQDIYAFPERESAVAKEPGRRVYRVIQVFSDKDGEAYYGIRNGEGSIERMPVVQSRHNGPRRVKYATSGSSD